ncbi:MAG: methyltransferase domain-containing protein [Spirulina sp. SIO3F2]|nr:methyltransferase domain-containing protein [Spirulina sp. SIO3F2]
METLVQQQYDRLAKIYDQRWQFYVSNTLNFLIDWAEIRPKEMLLDVACGTGEFERLLIQRNPEQRIIGVDFSAQMLAIAHTKHKDAANLTFQLASASALPWSTPQFDAVVCANAFHYFDKPETVLAQFAQVLNPGGRVIILDWCRDFWFCQVCDWVLGWLDPAHKRCYTEAELRGLLTQGGFRVVRSQRQRFGWIWGLMVVEAWMGDE